MSSPPGEIRHARKLNFMLRFDEALAKLDALERRQGLDGAGHELRRRIRINRDGYEYRTVRNRLTGPPGIGEKIRNRLGGRGRQPIGLWQGTRKGRRLILRGQLLRDFGRIFVFVDDLLLKAINTRPASGEGPVRREFRLSLVRQVTRRFSRRPAIVVATERGVLYHGDNERQWKPRLRRADDTLAERLERGELINKKGRIIVPRNRDEEWQRQVLDTYQEMDAWLERHYGYRLWIIYGSLLGLMRENDFIPHDDDFDTAYLSRHDNPEAVRKELVEIAHLMIDDGIPVRISPTGVLKPLKSGRAKALDIYGTWLAEGHFWAQSTTKVPMRREEMEPFQNREFKGRQVLVPARPEAFLERKYGPDWRSPDPGYQRRMAEGAKEALARVIPSRKERESITRRTEKLRKKNRTGK